MDFRTPTSKSDMLDVLKEIFHYYRIQRQGYTPAELTPLSIDKIVRSPLTAQEIADRASAAVVAAQNKEILEKTEELNAKITALTEELGLTSTSVANEKAEVTALYTASENKVRNEAVKKGLGNSSIVLDKIAELESAKNNKLAEIEAKNTEKTNKITAEITALTAQRNNLNDDYEDIFDQEVIAKSNELAEKDEALMREVLKYNNTVEEKLVNNANNIETTNASLQLKFMAIESNFFTKDQLVEMGYYEDVLACLNSYYETLSPSDALSDIISTSKLALYLDEFYESFVYLYSVIAGQ